MRIGHWMRREKRQALRSLAAVRMCSRCTYKPAVVGARCQRCINDEIRRYERDRDKIRASQRTPASRKLAAERKRREYLRRRDIILQRVKAWAARNKDKRRAYASTPHMRLHSNVSRAIRSAIRLNKAGRGWESLVGYTRGELVRHLERQFRDGMSWDNYGQWEIDHIQPRSAFVFATADDPQFKDCWALTNLQPLWMVDNRRKHAKVA